MEADYNHMAQHFEPILYPLGWAYKLLQMHLDPFELLMVAQALLQGACCICFLTLALSTTTPLLISGGSFWIFGLSYFSFWGVISAQTFEFHPVALGMSFSFLAVLANLKNSKMAFFYWIISTLCGEMFLVVGAVGIGLTLALSSKLSLRALALPIGFLCGCCALLAYLTYLAPKLRTDGQLSSLLGRYASLGASPQEILRNLIVNPPLVFQVLFTKEKILFAAKIAVIFLPTLSWLILKFVTRKRQKVRSFGALINEGTLFLAAGVFAVAAPLAKIYLSQAETYLVTRHHYLADVVPGLCLILASILIYFSGAIQKFDIQGTAQKIGCILLSFVGLAFHVYKNFQLSEFAPRSWIKNILDHHSTHLPLESRLVLNSIDSSKSIYSDTFGFSHIISKRRFYYTEFTNDSVYKKHGYPDYLLLVYNPPKKAAGGAALHKSIDKTESGDLIIATTNERYKLQRALLGQTKYGIHIFQRMSP